MDRTAPLQCILSLVTSMVNNLNYITCNFAVHDINARKKLQLHRAETEQNFII
jgi:hypothetical protein